MKWSWVAGVWAAVALLYVQGQRSGGDHKNQVTGATTRRRRRSSAAGKRGFLTIINEWPHERLIEIDGIGPVLATKIISHRPYNTPQELVEAKLLPPSAIEALQNAS